ncbi:MAG: hypothetical protein JJ975_08810 [Bacteroidia bacterium]|nr:hypothetical protein [Bacteroidia bacterium]
MNLKTAFFLLGVALSANSYSQSWNFDISNPIKNSIKLKFNSSVSGEVEASFKKLDSSYALNPHTLFCFGHSEFSSNLAANQALSKNNSGHVIQTSSKLDNPPTVYWNKAKSRSVTVDNNDLPKQITIPNGYRLVAELDNPENGSVFGNVWKYYIYNQAQKKFILQKIVFTKFMQRQIVATYFVQTKEWSLGSTSGKFPYPVCKEETNPSEKPQLLIEDGTLKATIEKQIPGLKTARGQIMFTCKVNCRSQLADLSVMRVMGLDSYSGDIEKILSDAGNKWAAGKHNGENVDAALTIIIRVSGGNIMIRK